MDYSLRALEQLIAVVEEGSFTRAAERLNVAQPWLSACIRRLEAVAGIELLDRSTRNIVPTKLGEPFLAQARAVSREARQLHRLAGELARGAGTLRIGAAPYTYYMEERQALLTGFAAAQPTIDVQIENGQDPHLRRGVLHGELDAAIVTGTAPGECESLIVRRNPVMLLIPAEHPLAQLPSISGDALIGRNVAGWRRDANPVAWDETLGRLADAGTRIVPLPEPMRRAQIDLARQDRLVLATLGSMPGDEDAAGSAKEADRLVIRPLAANMRADITLIRRAADPPRPALDRFWAYAVRMFADSASI